MSIGEFLPLGLGISGAVLSIIALLYEMLSFKRVSLKRRNEKIILKAKDGDISLDIKQAEQLYAYLKNVNSVSKYVNDNQQQFEELFKTLDDRNTLKGDSDRKIS